MRFEDFLAHHGIKGQRWGVKNGPPYPLDQETAGKVRMHAKNKGDSRYDNVSNKELSSIPIEKLSDIERLPKNGLFRKTNMEEVRRRINHPNGYDEPGRTYNCPNCAAAFEMTERGYSVCARAKRNGSNVEDIEKFFKNGHLDKVNDDNIVNEITAKLKPFPSLEYNKARTVDKAEKIREKWFKDQAVYEDQLQNVRDKAIKNFLGHIHKQGDGSRGIIVVGWMQDLDLSVRTTGYHALNYKIEKGKLIFYDTQSHRSYKYNGDTDYGWLYGADPRELYCMQTNNLELDERITLAVRSI